jgi:large subunit ribosomal protein L25
MSEQPLLAVRSRDRVGSSHARRLRRQGEIPAVMYGHGAPQPIAISAADFTHTVPVAQYGSLMVRLRLDDQDVGLALVKAVQVNTLTHQVIGVDLLRVAMEDRIQVSVPLVFIGEATGVQRGGTLEQLAHSVSLRSRAADVPAEISYDVSTLDIGEAVRAGQLALPPNSELLESPELVLASLVPPTVPALEVPMVIQPGVSGPELTGDKQQDDSQLAA